MDGLNKAEEVVGIGSVVDVSDALGGVADGIRVVSDRDGLILRSSGIGIEEDAQCGDLLSRVVGVVTDFNAEIEVSRVDGLPIDGDGESVFELIDLSIGLCEQLREGDGRRWNQRHR